MSTLKQKAAGSAAVKPTILSRIRWKVQLFFLIALNPLWITQWRAYRSAACVPVLNCHGCPAAGTHCPIGVMGDMLKIGIIPWLAIGAFGLFGALFGRLSCAWICPFGFLQDILAKIPVPKWKPPIWTRFSKYAILIGMVIVVPILIGTDTNWFFCSICPEATLKANGWFLVFEGKTIPWDRLAFLAGFIALIVFVRRGFCRLVCPIGAGLALFNKLSIFSIKFNKDTCVECGQCIKACPKDTGPMEDPRDPECFHCLECLKRCKSLNANCKEF